MKVIIFGNGRIARVIYQYIKPHYEIGAFTVDGSQLADTSIDRHPVISFDNIENHFSPNEYKILIAVGYQEMNSLRTQKSDEAKEKGYELTNFIHPSIKLDYDLSIGVGNIILENVAIQPTANIGNNNFVWSNAIIGHGAEIKNNCWIASGAAIGGDAKINSNCFLGLNSTVGHNVILAEKSLIGANSFVNKNTEEGSVLLAGSPSKHRLDSGRFIKFFGL